ncbi:MAG: molybdopterin biosynthesis protein [Nitrospirota bacterium]
MARNIYLTSTPLDEAMAKWNERLSEEGLDKPVQPEPVCVTEASGRLTAEALFAKISSPFYHSAAMDGYAVRFAETFGASETVLITLKVGEQAIYVDTGDPMPEGFNAVIMIEDVNMVKGQGARGKGSERGSELQTSNFELIEIIEPATPWQHVRTIGEDIVATELIVPENHRIRPVDIGALLAGGQTEISVRKRPVVAIIPTGDELVEPGSQLIRGAIIEYNSSVLSGLVSEWGGVPVRNSIVPDDINKLKEAIISAHQGADVVVVNAGSSAGSKDFTAQAIRELGEVIIHGVGIKPGKPVVLGLIKGKPVIGIPGYPVSTYITFNIFVKPVIYRMQGLNPDEPERIKAIVSRHVPSSLGQEEFVRVKVGVVGDKTVATPVSRGAGVIMSLVRADGILRIPSMSEGIGAGREVEIEILRPRHEISNTIVCIGSHDNTLDMLSNYLKKRFPKYSLSSGHVGSMGGLIALKRGEAHIAGTHLLDESSGEYNIPFIKRLIPEKKIVLINLIYRQQGFIVRKGNPKNIKGFDDLLRDDVVFINRQSGSGTRLLTDRHLKEMNIDNSAIRGYGREEYTHMGVASAVMSSMADTGIAVLSAAKALDLDFIPIAKERYDLAIPHEFLGYEMIRALLSVINEDKEFRHSVLNLGGYDISDMGRVMYEGG